VSVPASNQANITVRIPFRLVKRGGRKEMHLPNRPLLKTTAADSTIKALARAYRWKQMLETGTASTIGDVAKQDGVAPSYVARLLHLTLLAPDLVETILEGRQCLPIGTFKASVPLNWTEQRQRLGIRI